MMASTLSGVIPLAISDVALPELTRAAMLYNSVLVLFVWTCLHWAATQFLRWYTADKEWWANAFCRRSASSSISSVGGKVSEFWYYNIITSAHHCSVGLLMLPIMFCGSTSVPAVFAWRYGIMIQLAFDVHDLVKTYIEQLFTAEGTRGGWKQFVKVSIHHPVSMMMCVPAVIYGNDAYLQILFFTHAGMGGVQICLAIVTQTFDAKSVRGLRSTRISAFASLLIVTWRMRVYFSSTAHLLLVWHAEDSPVMFRIGMFSALLMLAYNMLLFKATFNYLNKVVKMGGHHDGPMPMPAAASPRKRPSRPVFRNQTNAGSKLE